MKARRLFVAFTTFALLMSATVTTALAESSGDVGIQFHLKLTKLGTTQVIGGSSSTFSGKGLTGEQGPDPGAAGGEALVHGHGGAPPVPPTQAPRPGTQSLVNATGTTHFQGLNHFDHRTAGTGKYTETQLSLEPPDQGLCVGKGFVVETVNTVIRVRNTAGTILAPAMPLTQFFGLAPEINRDTGNYGAFLSDPKCYFDTAAGGHWFLTILELGQSKAGAFTGTSRQLIAVSTGSNPTGMFNLYTFATNDDGKKGTPVHPDCPCYGDQPLIGADANGFYITTNEFSIFAPAFNGAIVYAMRKSALTSGSGGDVNAFWEPSLVEGQAYSLQPATTPPGGAYAGENGGAEYFLSALEFTGGLDNRIALWALTNTSSLNSAHPQLKMAVKVLKSEVYGLPPVVTQKSGPAPLRDLLADPVLAPAVFQVPAADQPIPYLNSNDDRMQQAVYVDGQIWGALSTVVENRHGDQHVGVAWFAVKPSTGNKLDGWITSQGYVAVDKNDLVFPSIAANTHGDVLVAFTLAGPGYYPSAAYARLDNSGGAGSVRVVSHGVGPADGFIGYPSLVPDEKGIERWGDYSAAVADESGNLWFATETINQSCTFDDFLNDTSCGHTRTILANWGTTIAKVHP